MGTPIFVYPIGDKPDHAVMFYTGTQRLALKLEIGSIPFLPKELVKKLVSQQHVDQYELPFGPSDELQMLESQLVWCMTTTVATIYPGNGNYMDYVEDDSELPCVRLNMFMPYDAAKMVDPRGLFESVRKIFDPSSIS